MQRLYDDNDSMIMIGHDSPVVQHDIDLVFVVFIHSSEKMPLIQRIVLYGCSNA